RLHAGHEVHGQGVVAVEAGGDEVWRARPPGDVPGEGVAPEGLVRPYRGEGAVGELLDGGAEVVRAAVVEHEQPGEVGPLLAGERRKSGGVEEPGWIVKPVRVGWPARRVQYRAEAGQQDVVERPGGGHGASLQWCAARPRRPGAA